MRNLLISLTDDIVDLMDAACETYEMGRGEYIETVLWNVLELKDLARRCRIKRKPRVSRGRPAGKKKRAKRQSAPQRRVKARRR